MHKKSLPVFVSPEKRSPVCPNDRRHKHNISPPHTYDRSCYDDHNAAQDLQRDLDPLQEDIHCHQPINTQQHEQKNNIHCADSHQQTCRRWADKRLMSSVLEAAASLLDYSSGTASLPSHELILFVVARYPRPVCCVKSDSERVKWSAISQPSVSS